MSDLLIQAALEKRLATLSPAIATVEENVAFKPVHGVPYKRIAFMPATPDDLAITNDIVEYSGLFQVSLLYPEGVGRGAAQAYAGLIRAHFKPYLALTEGGVKVEILKTPAIAGGFQHDDRWHLPVTIYWTAFITS